MRNRVTVALGAIGIGVLLSGSSSAVASTQVGNTCDSDTSVVVGFEGTLFPIAAGSSGANPTSSPVTGIATSWTAQTSSTDSHYVRLKVLRPVSSQKEVAIVGESQREGVSQGHGTFPIRIPIQAGDRFGLSGPGGALACKAFPGEVMGATTGNGAIGSTQQYFELTNYQVSLSVTIEADADGDGYGDETQDRCPQLAAIQSNCPPVTLTATAKSGSKLIAIDVTPSADAPVAVAGLIGWRTPSPGDTPPDSTRKRMAHLAAVSKTIGGGVPSRFELALPKSVLRRLAKLDRKRHLTAHIDLWAANVAGETSTQSLKVPLRGRR